LWCNCESATVTVTATKFWLTVPVGSSTWLMVMVRVKLARLIVTSSAVPKTASGPGSTMHSTPALGQAPAVDVQPTSSVVPTIPSGPAHNNGWAPLLKMPPFTVLLIEPNGICWLFRAV